MADCLIGALQESVSALGNDPTRKRPDAVAREVNLGSLAGVIRVEAADCRPFSGPLMNGEDPGDYVFIANRGMDGSEGRGLDAWLPIGEPGELFSVDRTPASPARFAVYEPEPWHRRHINTALRAALLWLRTKAPDWMDLD